MKPLGSLRNQMLLGLLPALALIWVLATCFIIWRAWDELRDSYIDQLDQLSHTLANLLDARVLTPEAAVESVAARRDRNFYIIVTVAGRSVLRSPRAPETLDDARFLTVEATAQNGDLHVVAGLERKELHELIWEIFRGTALPMGLALLAMTGALIFTVRRSLAPLARLRRDLALRGGGDLSALGTAGLPSEIHPLVRALNLLLERLAHAQDRERRFVADASHELRTPLTAIRAQVEAIDRERIDPQTAETLRHILSAVDRSSRLARQLLRLARADAGSGVPQAGVALDEAVRSITADLFPQAVRQNVDIEVRAEPALVIAGLEDLDMILGNLIENAILHGGRGGELRVSCGQTHGCAWLMVEDRGKGIPADRHAAVFERFHRGAGQAVSGAGLGLAIVGSVAQRLGAQVTLGVSPDLGGLQVRVDFARAPADPAQTRSQDNSSS